VNLTIRPFCNTHRVIVESGRAVGVEIECGGVVQKIRARRVTLSAGAINSPAILMRSGVGPSAELRALGIEPVIDLPGVGRNLIDHLLVPVVAIPSSGVPHDPLVTNPIGIRYTASGSTEFNDMQIYILNFYNKDLWEGPPLDVPWQSIAVTPGLQRPRARGAGQFTQFRRQRTGQYRSELS
jgi:choline dehydrogenase